jgi:hypothetical protein
MPGVLSRLRGEHTRSDKPALRIICIQLRTTFPPTPLTSVLARQAGEAPSGVQPLKGVLFTVSVLLPATPGWMLTLAPSLVALPREGAPLPVHGGVPRHRNIVSRPMSGPRRHPHAGMPRPSQGISAALPACGQRPCVCRHPALDPTTPDSCLHDQSSVLVAA